MRIKMLCTGLSDPFDPDLKTLTTTTAIRKCWSTLGQACTDPSLREAIPRVIMHSGDTARQHYDQSGLDNIRKVAEFVDKTLFTTSEHLLPAEALSPPPGPTAEELEREWNKDLESCFKSHPLPRKKAGPFTQDQLCILARPFLVRDGKVYVNIAAALSCKKDAFKIMWEEHHKSYQTQRKALQRVRVALQSYVLP